VKKIMIVYHSQEAGNTKAMAELVAEGCKQVPGVRVSLINTNEARVDMDTFAACDGVALGSPDYYSYVAGGLKQFFDDVTLAAWAGKNVKGKPYVGFVTHGGGGHAVNSLESLAKSCEFEKVAESVLSRGKPAGEVVDAARALGKALAEKVSKG
jgi:multimeric flavodoxin WrbA